MHLMIFTFCCILHRIDLILNEHNLHIYSLIEHNDEKLIKKWTAKKIYFFSHLIYIK